MHGRLVARHGLAAVRWVPRLVPLELDDPQFVGLAAARRLADGDSDWAGDKFTKIYKRRHSLAGPTFAKGMVQPVQPPTSKFGNFDGHGS